jgi:MYXO-CTERM domain-containing protein
MKTMRTMRIKANLVASLVAASAAFSKDVWARKPMHEAVSTTPEAVCSVNYSGVTGSIPYRGGAVIANVHAIPVFWTANVDPAIQAWAEGYLATLVDSAHMDLLAEYSTVGLVGGSNQKIGHGTAGPGVVITPSIRGTTVIDSNGQIADELEAQVTAGNLPAPVMDDQGNPNTLYIVFFPRGTVISDGTGSSCSQFCAYHGSGGRNSEIIYAVIPDMSASSRCSMGCADSCTTGIVDISVGSVSHEFAEAVSDPVNGWYSTTNRTGSEIGDICASTSATQTDTAIVPGTSIKAQFEWSQKNRKCLIAPTDFDGGTPVVDAGTRDARSDVTTVDSGPGRDGGAGAGGTGGSGGATGTAGSPSGGSGGVGVGGSAGAGVAGSGPAAGGASMGTGGGAAGRTIGSGGAGEGGAIGRNRAPAADDGGCSCKVGRTSRASGAWSALALLALFSWKRRRRV